MTDTTTTPTPTGPIVARPGTYYRRVRYLLFAGMLLLAGWFAYDGWIAWPQRNEQIRLITDQKNTALQQGDTTRVAELDRQSKELGDIKNDASILLQKILALGLPPIAILALTYWLWRSRGEYRLENNIIDIPGHPPIPLDAITRVDSRNWTRKGIARIAYNREDGTESEFTLDDFLYQRKPTDEIYTRISEQMGLSEQIVKNRERMQETVSARSEQRQDEPH